MRTDYHDHFVDALRYQFEATKWRKWFDTQAWYYRWFYWAKLSFKQQFTRLTTLLK